MNTWIDSKNKNRYDSNRTLGKDVLNMDFQEYELLLDLAETKNITRTAPNIPILLRKVMWNNAPAASSAKHSAQ